jgi:hypothetical protein
MVDIKYIGRKEKSIAEIVNTTILEVADLLDSKYSIEDGILLKLKLKSNCFWISNKKIATFYVSDYGCRVYLDINSSYWEEVKEFLDTLKMYLKYNDVPENYTIEVKESDCFY